MDPSILFYYFDPKFDELSFINSHVMRQNTITITWMSYSTLYNELGSLAT